MNCTKLFDAKEGYLINVFVQIGGGFKLVLIGAISGKCINLK